MKEIWNKIWRFTKLPSRTETGLTIANWIVISGQYKTRLWTCWCEQHSSTSSWNIWTVVVFLLSATQRSWRWAWCIVVVRIQTRTELLRFQESWPLKYLWLKPTWQTNRVDKVCRKLCSLGHRPRHNGGSSCRKDEVKEPMLILNRWHRFKEEIAIADEGISRFAKGESISKCPIDESGDNCWGMMHTYVSWKNRILLILTNDKFIV